jgi:hypothetical protein
VLFQQKYEYGTMKPVEVILRNVMEYIENDGGDEPNWDIICVCVYGNDIMNTTV